MPYQGDAELPCTAQCAKPLLASPCAARVVVYPLALFFSVEWLPDVSSYPLSSSLARAIAAAKDGQEGLSHSKAKSVAPGHFHCMHVESELVEFMIVGEQEYEEVIEKYEEEILI